MPRGGCGPWDSPDLEVTRDLKGQTKGFLFQGGQRKQGSQMWGGWTSRSVLRTRRLRTVCLEGQSILRRRHLSSGGAVCPQEGPSVLWRSGLLAQGLEEAEAHPVFALLDHRGRCFSTSPMTHRMGLRMLCSFKYEAKFCFVVFPNFEN